MTRLIKADDKRHGGNVRQAEFEPDVVRVEYIIQAGAGRFDFAPYHSFHRVRYGAD